MAVSIANVTHPNQNVWEGEFLGQKARVIDVTFDSSYDNANGEAISASTLGLQSIYGVFVMAHGYSGTSTDLTVVVTPVINSAKTSVALRCFQANGGAAGLASLGEVANAADLSSYTARIVVIGV
jgi:hypothetical protein